MIVPRWTAWTVLAGWTSAFVGIHAAMGFSESGLAGAAAASDSSPLGRLALKTLILAGVAAIASVAWMLIPALASAWAVRGWERSALQAAAITPLLVPPMVTAVAAVWLFGAFDQPLGFDVFSPQGVALTFLWAFAPAAFPPLALAIRRLPRDLLESARLETNLGGMIVWLALPLAAGGAAIGGFFVFMLSMTEFGIPESLRAESVLATEIYIQFGVFYNRQAALRASLLISTLALAVLLAGWFLLPRESASSVIAEPLHLPAGARLTLRAGAWLMAGLPPALLFTVLIGTMGRSAGIGEIASIVADTAREEIAQTAKIAAAGGAIAAFTGLLLGAALASLRQPTFLRLLVAAGFLIPGPVLGVALKTIFNPPIDSLPWDLDDRIAEWDSTMIPLLLAYVIKFAPVTAILFEQAVRKTPQEVREAQLLDGDSFIARWRAWIAPAVLGPAAAGLLLSAILIAGEAGAAVLLMPPGTTTLSVRLLTLMHNAPTSQVSALCLMLMAAGLVGLPVMIVLFRQLEEDRKR